MIASQSWFLILYILMFWQTNRHRHTRHRPFPRYSTISVSAIETLLLYYCKITFPCSNLLLPTGSEQQPANYVITIYGAFGLPNGTHGQGDRRYGKLPSSFVRVSFCGLSVTNTYIFCLEKYYESLERTVSHHWGRTINFMVSAKAINYYFRLIHSSFQKILNLDLNISLPDQ